VATSSDELVLHQAVVEVRYDRGVVYLDRCGKLTVQLEQLLGKPFKPKLPNMEHGELSNDAERLLVRYGVNTFLVAQNWVRTPVRVEQLAPAAWEIVASTLEVGHTVTRVGVRLQVVWPVKTVAEGESVIGASGLCTESTAWRDIFGVPQSRSWTFASRDHRGELRAGLTTIQTNVQGSIDPELRKLVPDVGVLLDTDHVLPLPAGAEHGSLNREKMKEFIRMSWQRTKEAATKTGPLLGFGRLDNDG
jgi:hypothetical protein